MRVYAVIIGIAAWACVARPARADFHPRGRDANGVLSALDIGSSTLVMPPPVSSSARRSAFGRAGAGSFTLAPGERDPLRRHATGTAPTTAVVITFGRDLRHLRFHKRPPGGREIRQAPPLPGNAQLALSALLAAGAWHLTRSSVRHLHLGAVPEWFHSDAPPQVGHAVAFDYDRADLPPCIVDLVEVADGHVPCLTRDALDDGARRHQASIVRTLAPRAPPIPMCR